MSTSLFYPFVSIIQPRYLVNHGIFPPEDMDLVDMDLSQWQRSVDVNLTGQFNLSFLFYQPLTRTILGSFLVAREFLRRLRNPREGYAPDLSKVAIVVMGSTSGDFGEEGHVGEPLVFKLCIARPSQPQRVLRTCVKRLRLHKISSTSRPHPHLKDRDRQDRPRWTC